MKTRFGFIGKFAAIALAFILTVPFSSAFALDGVSAPSFEIDTISMSAAVENVGAVALHSDVAKTNFIDNEKTAKASVLSDSGKRTLGNPASIASNLKADNHKKSFNRNYSYERMPSIVRKSFYSLYKQKTRYV